MNRFGTYLVLLIVGLAISCGRGSSDSPVAPDSTSTRSTSGIRQFWGIHRIAIDTRTGEVEIVPIREGLFHANVVTFLQPPSPMGLGVQLLTMNLPEGEIDALVSITHPFTNPFYTGFDVRGIFIAPGSIRSLVNNNIVLTSSEEARLLNLDGMTRWWNPSEFKTPGLFGYTEGVLGTRATGFLTTLNPFKYFSDDLNPGDDFLLEPGSRNVFRASMTNSRIYSLKFPTLGGGPIIMFNYAVDASWEEPSGDPTDLDNFPQAANMQEPYQITVTDNGSTAYYDGGTGEYGGDLNLKLGIRRHFGDVNPSWVIDELTSIVLENPELIGTAVSIDPAGPHVQDGDGVIYDVSIPNVTPSSAYNQDLLVHVGTSVGTYQQGFDGIIAPGDDIAAYALFEAPVYDGFPPADVPLVESVDVTRNPSGRLNGFSIDWADSEGAVEYVVYISVDPYEFDGPLQLVPTPDSPITDSAWQMSVASADIDEQWMVRITAGSIAGQSGSESDFSTPVLIDFEAFEFQPTEGQNEWYQRYNKIRNDFFYLDLPGHGVELSGTLILWNPPTYISGRTITYCVSPELPDLPGTTRCYFEFAHLRNGTIGPEYGYSVCTSPSIEEPGIIRTYLKDPVDDAFRVNDYAIDVVDESNWVSGDVMNDPDIDGMRWRYNDTDESSDPTNGWSGSPNFSFVVSKYDAPKVITEGHKHVGVCFAGAEVGGYYLTGVIPGKYPLVCDEFALVVY